MYNKTTLLVLCFMMSLTVIFGATNIQIKQDGGSTASVTKPFPASLNNDNQFTTEVFQNGETTTASTTTVNGQKTNVLMIPIGQVATGASVASGALSTGFLYMEWISTPTNRLLLQFKDTAGVKYMYAPAFSVAP